MTYQQVCCLSSLKYLNALFGTNFQHFSKRFFQKFQCSFRNGYSTQHYLLMMLESWKEAVDKGKAFGALMMDLSKTLLASVTTY